MSETFNVNLLVDVLDPDELLEAAIQKTLADDVELTEPEVRQALTDERGETDIAACLEVVFDPGESPPAGTVVQECNAA